MAELPGAQVLQATIERERARIFAQCDAMTLIEVRARRMAHQWYPMEVEFVDEWIVRKSYEQEEARRDEDNRRVESTIAAARSSARWTMWAALLSLFATLVTVLPAIMERWLP